MSAWVLPRKKLPRTAAERACASGSSTRPLPAGASGAAALLLSAACAQDVSPPGPATLTNSGPVTATTDGQIIENIRITANGAPGITINGRLNVVVRNVQIHHTGNVGISITGGSHGTQVQNVNIIHEGAPPSGQNPSSGLYNIYCQGSNDVSISYARLRKGSSGIWAGSCPRIHARFIEGYDFRGPFPRGQLFQVDHSHYAILEDFYTQNPINTSWTEANVNIWRSSNAIVRRGLIDGNNSPSGIGVIFEHGDDIAHTGLVEDVDTIHMRNGSFSAAHARNITFRRVRARDNICGDIGGRGASLSNSLMFASYANQLSSGIRYFAAEYWNSCNGNIAWDLDTMEVKEFTQANYTPRRALNIIFSWEGRGGRD
jgi:Right handed beta helix region